MFAILLFAFVSTFIAIAALGHALLFAAIWPGVFDGRREAQGDAIVGVRQRHLPT